MGHDSHNHFLEYQRLHYELQEMYEPLPRLYIENLLCKQLSLPFQKLVNNHFFSTKSWFAVKFAASARFPKCIAQLRKCPGFVGAAGQRNRLIAGSPRFTGSPWVDLGIATVGFTPAIPTIPKSSFLWISTIMVVVGSRGEFHITPLWSPSVCSTSLDLILGCRTQTMGSHSHHMKWFSGWWRMVLKEYTHTYIYIYIYVCMYLYIYIYVCI